MYERVPHQTGDGVAYERLDQPCIVEVIPAKTRMRSMRMIGVPYLAVSPEVAESVDRTRLTEIPGVQNDESYTHVCNKVIPKRLENIETGPKLTKSRTHQAPTMRPIRAAPNVLSMRAIIHVQEDGQRLGGTTTGREGGRIQLLRLRASATEGYKSRT